MLAKSSVRFTEDSACVSTHKPVCVCVCVCVCVQIKLREAQEQLQAAQEEAQRLKQLVDQAQ